MGGDCVDVSVWLGWVWLGWVGRGGGVVVTQPKIAVSHVCYVELAGRVSLSRSLAPSLRVSGQHQVRSHPSFLQFERLFTVCSRRFPQRPSFSSPPSLVWHFDVLDDDSQLETAQKGAGSVTRALFTHLSSLLFPPSWPVGCEGGSRSERPVK